MQRESNIVKANFPSLPILAQRLSVTRFVFVFVFVLLLLLSLVALLALLTFLSEKVKNGEVEWSEKVTELESGSSNPVNQIVLSNDKSSVFIITNNCTLMKFDLEERRLTKESD